jgi:hypothetical protein
VLERVGHEIESHDRDIRRLQGERRRDRLGREREHGQDRITNRGGRVVIARSTDGIEDRLRRIQEAEPVRPSVEVRGAVVILLGEVQTVRGVVGGPGTPLVFAVLGRAPR